MKFNYNEDKTIVQHIVSNCLWGGEPMGREGSLLVHTGVLSTWVGSMCSPSNLSLSLTSLQINAIPKFSIRMHSNRPNLNICALHSRVFKICCVCYVLCSGVALWCLQQRSVAVLWSYPICVTKVNISFSLFQLCSRRIQYALELLGSTWSIGATRQIRIQPFVLKT